MDSELVSPQDLVTTRFPELAKQPSSQETVTLTSTQSYLTAEAARWEASIGHAPQDPVPYMKALGLDTTMDPIPASQENLSTIFKAKHTSAMISTLATQLKALADSLTDPNTNHASQTDKYLATQLALEKARLVTKLDRLDTPESGYAKTRTDLQALSQEHAILLGHADSLHLPYTEKLLSTEGARLQAELKSKGADAIHSLNIIDRLTSMREVLKHIPLS